MNIDQITALLTRMEETRAKLNLANARANDALDVYNRENEVVEQLKTEIHDLKESIKAGL